jgi:DNA-binding HxlR family transcriptional regulator
MNNSKIALGEELRRLIEARMKRTLSGIEETLQQVLKNQTTSLEDLKKDIRGLEDSFNLLSQKWNLEILYLLFLKSASSFNELKKILGVNSRTLSDKLKNLRRYEYIKRTVKTGPPLRVEYCLTIKGKNTVLLALPLLYYSSTTL